CTAPPAPSEPSSPMPPLRWTRWRPCAPPAPASTSSTSDEHRATPCLGLSLSLVLPVVEGRARHAQQRALPGDRVVGPRSFDQGAALGYPCSLAKKTAAFSRTRSPCAGARYTGVSSGCAWGCSVFQL